jgi:hypothetical protein
VDRSLRRAVLERLAAIEELALRAGSHLPVRVARTQFKTITDGWREVLLEHQPDRKDRCPVCSGWLRRRRWPCQVWVTAHHHLIGDGSGLAEQLGRRSARFPRPRQAEVIPRQVEVIPRQVGAPSAADQSTGRYSWQRDSRQRAERDTEPGSTAPRARQDRRSRA